MASNPGPQQSRIVPAFIESASVVDVDMQRYTVSVVTENTQRAYSDISFATPYQHFSNGEGIYFMPEVGSLCWICWASDNAKRPFVLAWQPGRDDDDGRRASKMQLNPGDIYLGTRDENFLILRRGGIVQVGGGPLCQRMFMPVNNFIRDYCENYTLQALGGELDWTIVRPENTSDGHRPAAFSLRAKEFADDAEHVALLEVGSSKGDVSKNGSHTKNGSNILSLVIKESGKKGAATKISLEFRKDGSAEWSFEKDVTWKLKGKLSISAEGDVTISSKAKSRLEGMNAEIEATMGSVSIKGKTTVDVMAGTSVNLGPQVNMGVSPGAGGAAGTKAVMLADDSFLNWIFTHQHTSTPPNTPTSPPLLADAIKASQGYKAKKSFGK